MGESPIFAKLLGEITSSPIFFAPDCGPKLWANAKQTKWCHTKSKLYNRPKFKRLISDVST